MKLFFLIFAPVILPTQFAWAGTSIQLSDYNFNPGSAMYSSYAHKALIMISDKSQNPQMTVAECTAAGPAPTLDNLKDCALISAQWIEMSQDEIDRFNGSFTVELNNVIDQEGQQLRAHELNKNLFSAALGGLVMGAVDVGMGVSVLRGNFPGVAAAGVLVGEVIFWGWYSYETYQDAHSPLPSLEKKMAQVAAQFAQAGKSAGQPLSLDESVFAPAYDLIRRALIQALADTNMS